MTARTGGPILLPSIEDIEEVYYEAACQTFTDPDYKMPPLRWHDRDRMVAALNAVENSYYQSVPELGAALAYYISKNHPLVDGNKRLSIVILLSFLFLNKYLPVRPLSVQEGVDFIESIVTSDRASMDETLARGAEWIGDRFARNPRRFASLLKRLLPGR